MIIYGTNAAHLATTQSKTATCENCGTQGSIVISTFRRHAHIFWIPLFPIGKTGASECQNCKQVLKPKEMPERLRREYDELKNMSSGPIWQFSGSLLILVLILWGVYASAKDSENEKIYLEQPEIGDVYDFKTETGNYSTFKLVEISDDSVSVLMNEYEIDQSSKTYKIDKEENYEESFYTISKKDLVEMYNDGEITDISRK